MAARHRDGDIYLLVDRRGRDAAEMMFRVRPVEERRFESDRRSGGGEANQRAG